VSAINTSDERKVNSRLFMKRLLDPMMNWGISFGLWTSVLLH